MFEPHFGLRENPFSTGHDPRFVYPSPEHLEAVAHFRYGIQNREAFVLVTGEVGTGKTTAIYDLVSRLPQQAHVALINNSALTRLELLEEIARRFGVEPPAMPSKPALLSALELRLSAHNGKGEACILIVDEAQNLSNDLLEEIRLLSNLDDRGGHLLHICLVGQPELEEKLARIELRQLRQRISVKYRLNPLSAEECVRYIHHRLRVAGGEPESIFPEDSAYAVHRLTHGIPREINIVASQAMVNAYVEGTRPVRPDHVRAVSDEFSFQSVLGGTGAPAAIPAATQPAVAPAPPPPAPRATMPSQPPRVAPAPTPAVAAALKPAPAPVQRPVAPPPPPAPAAPTAGGAPRTVSNWRERRPVVAAPSTPVVITPRPVTPVSPYTAPAAPPAPASPPIAHEATAAPAESLDREEARARRMRLIAVAISVVAALIIVAVLYSTGLIGNRPVARGPGDASASRTPRPAATAPPNAPAAAAPATAAAPESASGATRAGAAGTAPAAAAPTPVFGFQVASFRTAGTATRVLKEMTDATHLNGEILANEDEGATWYRIVLGRYASEDEAKRVSQDLIARSLIPEAIVIPYTPREP